MNCKDCEFLVKAAQAMLDRLDNSRQNWTQAAIDAQRSGNHELSVQIQNTVLQALSGFPEEELRAALQYIAKKEKEEI